MSQATPPGATDWVRNARSYALAWGLPSASLVAAMRSLYHSVRLETHVGDSQRGETLNLCGEQD